MSGQNTPSLITPSNNKAFVKSNTRLYGEESDESAAEETEEDGQSDGGDETPAGDASGATDILNSPAFLKRKLEVLESDIKAVDEKSDAANELYKANKEEWGPQLDDLRKEYSNIQDRFKKQNSQGTTKATVEVARKFLEVLDNYDRAFAAVTPESDADKEVEASYKGTYEEILSTFKELGVEEVETVGVEFDYEFHQAVMMKPTEDYEEGIVSEELAKGFKMMGDKGELIRAAMVVVAA